MQAQVLALVWQELDSLCHHPRCWSNRIFYRQERQTSTQRKMLGGPDWKIQARYPNGQTIWKTECLEPEPELRSTFSEEANTSSYYPAPAPVMDKYILDNGKVVFSAQYPFPQVLASQGKGGGHSGGFVKPHVATQPPSLAPGDCGIYCIVT